MIYAQGSDSSRMIVTRDAVFSPICGSSLAPDSADDCNISSLIGMPRYWVRQDSSMDDCNKATRAKVVGCSYQGVLRDFLWRTIETAQCLKDWFAGIGGS